MKPVIATTMSIAGYRSRWFFKKQPRLHDGALKTYGVTLFRRAKKNAFA